MEAKVVDLLQGQEGFRWKVNDHCHSVENYLLHTLPSMSTMSVNDLCTDAFFSVMIFS